MKTDIVEEKGKKGSRKGTRRWRAAATKKNMEKIADENSKLKKTIIRYFVHKSTLFVAIILYPRWWKSSAITLLQTMKRILRAKKNLRELISQLQLLHSSAFWKSRFCSLHSFGWLQICPSFFLRFAHCPSSPFPNDAFKFI